MLTLNNPNETALELARRIRARRLQGGWTQGELADKVGLKRPTYVLFERTGRIALLRLLKVLDVLDLLVEFNRIGQGGNLAGLTHLGRPYAAGT
jgi:transcriptional regulator with XRE-family HTH domain